MIYLDPKNDLVFKRIFGEHPLILKSFLNAVLPLGEFEKIETIHYLTSEQTPDLTILKNSIVDVKCTDQKGRIFIVEMQMNWSSAFQQRVIFNVSKAYVRQLEKKQKYELLHPVFGLSIIDDIFDKTSDEFYHHYKIVNIENTNKTIDGLQLVFVELPKLFKSKVYNDKLRMLWLRFLNEIDEKTTTIDSEFLTVPEIKEASEISQMQAYTPQQLEWYDKFWDGIRVEKTFISESLESGYASGIEKGIEKGLAMALQKLVESGIPEIEAKKILQIH